MIVDRIVFLETFPTGNFSNQKLQVEGTLEPGETVEQAFIQARDKVNASFKAANPGLHIEINPELAHHLTESKELPTINIAAERLMIMMEDCKTIDELDKYKEDARKQGLGTEFAKLAAKILSPKQ